MRHPRQAHTSGGTKSAFEMQSTACFLRNGHVTHTTLHCEQKLRREQQKRPCSETVGKAPGCGGGRAAEGLRLPALHGDVVNEGRVEVHERVSGLGLWHRRTVQKSCRRFS